MELIRPGVIFLTIVRRMFCETPRDLYRLSKYTSYLDFGVCYPTSLLIMVIAITYATISPLILIPAVVYFGLGYIVYRYVLGI